jgi:hypothetical protein
MEPPFLNDRMILTYSASFADEDGAAAFDDNGPGIAVATTIAVTARTVASLGVRYGNDAATEMRVLESTIGRRRGRVRFRAEHPPDKTGTAIPQPPSASVLTSVQGSQNEYGSGRHNTGENTVYWHEVDVNLIPMGQKPAPCAVAVRLG